MNVNLFVFLKRKCNFSKSLVLTRAAYILLTVFVF